MNPRLSLRDQQVVMSVNLLSQVTTHQLLRLHFSEPNTSPTSRPIRTRRALRRLVKWGEIARVENRGIGAHIGGSDSYTYTPVGRKARRRDDHTVDVAEIYVRLVEAEREGRCEILEFSPEDVFVGGVKMKADAYLWLETQEGKSDWLLECDRGTETKPQLRGKLRAYTKTASKVESFPQVLFIVTYSYDGDLKKRQAMIANLARQEEYPEMFKVVGIDEAVGALI